MKNIVISGTNFWNPGDDFVRDGVIRILKNLFPGTQLNFLFYNFNQDFFPQNKFSGIHNMVSAGDLNAYKDFIDAVVIAGLSAGTEIKDLYNWVIENQLTDRVYLIGAGYENDYVDSHIKEEPELTIFKNAKIITGRTNKRPQLINDLGLSYKYINCPAILSVNNVKSIPEDKKIEKIAFSIQLPHGTGVPNHSCSASMYEMSIVLLSELFGKYEIELIAHHKSEYFHFLNLFKQFNVPIKIIFSSFYQDLFDTYPQYDLVITTRLHASLFANGFGIPGIIINDTDRHTHCLEGFKHSHWVNTKEKFYEVFDKIKEKNLSETALEINEFKNRLLAKYIETLCKPFGVGIDKLSGKDESVQPPNKNKLPVHFFTIVLNGKPFIEYHIEVFKKLPFEWHWHIVEGVAELKHDTAWSVENGGVINELLHTNGLSNDGTTEYLDKLQKKYPNNITVYRKSNGEFWDGKLEMVNEPLKNINDECLLWQVDSDELWTVKQITETRKMFLSDNEKTAAYFYCWYFVGEKLYISTKNTYGNHVDYEWLRVWRYEPGDKWLSHEPPALSREIAPDIWVDLGKIDPFKQEETEANNLV
ncbi:MAG: polysaccharide pyruvyl transferase family protein, partial [Ignavibacteriaceae bacterium]|nr:polysaccharide pyruvyl transferase family protein [Ignavibacteriaceae bacterium]